MEFLVTYVVFGVIALFLYVVSVGDDSHSSAIGFFWDPIGIFLVLALWPVFLVIFEVDRRIGHDEEAENERVKAERESAPPEIDLIGENAMTATPLKPAGKIRVEGKLFDATSQGISIAQGTEVEIVGKEIGAWVVRKIEIEE